MQEEKIKTIEELSAISADLKKQGKKIVLCHGCFDLLHYGHINHFIASKEKGDVLMVTITPDMYVQKGPGRPFFSQDIRLKQVAALQFVDYVALNKWETAVPTIQLLSPDIYSKGKEVLDNGQVDKVSEIQSNLAAEIESLNSAGGKLFLTEEPSFSSSRIINQITSEIPEETKDFLNNFKKEFKSDYILEKLKLLEGIKVLVLGDAILDDYIYCSPMGMTSKESLIAYKKAGSQLQAGGVFAVANNLANFTKEITLVAYAGRENEDFIAKNLREEVSPAVFFKEDSNSLTKTRYINDYRKLKIFEVYNKNEFALDSVTEEKILEYLKAKINDFDMIVAADFGHGFFSEKIIDFLCSCNKFLAVFCQLNSGNSGYNFITKYRKADFVSMNDYSLKLPFQEKSVEKAVEKLNLALGAGKINITLGKFGSLYYQNGQFCKASSFTQEVLDTMGTDDAVLAVTSLLAFKGVEAPLVPFLGNCVGALAVKIMGNTKPVDLIELKKFISYILK